MFHFHSSSLFNILIGLSIVSCRWDHLTRDYDLKPAESKTAVHFLLCSQRNLRPINQVALTLRLYGGKKRDSNRKISSRVQLSKRIRGDIVPTNVVDGQSTQYAPIIVAVVPITASADALTAQNSLLSACASENGNNIDHSMYLQGELGESSFSRLACHRTVKLPPHCTRGTATWITFMAVSGTDANELLDAAKVCLHTLADNFLRFGGKSRVSACSDSRILAGCRYCDPASRRRRAAAGLSLCRRGSSSRDGSAGRLWSAGRCRPGASACAGAADARRGCAGRTIPP